MDVLIESLLTLGLVAIISVACFAATRRVPMADISATALHELAGEEDPFGHGKHASQ